MSMGMAQCQNSHYCIASARFRSKELSSRQRSRRCEVRCEERSSEGGKKKLKIIIAGGGIGGLVLALAAKHRGFEVKVFEKDVSSVRGEGRDRGPIQLMSSALAVLEAIDRNVAAQVMEAGCVVATKNSNGFADGVSGQWFTKIDLWSPVIKRGLRVSRVICRMELQEILVNAVGFDVLNNNSKVVDFMEDSDKVSVVLEDGRQFHGDILIGADGLWSRVRTKLFGKQEAVYSGYTCYSGALTSPLPYAGYKVFLGRNKYFVYCDVGNGRIQWYAFHKEPLSNTTHSLAGKKKRLFELFGNWCDQVVTLISETQVASALIGCYQPSMEFEGPLHLHYLTSLLITSPAMYVGRKFLQRYFPQFITWVLTAVPQGVRVHGDGEKNDERVIQEQP